MTERLEMVWYNYEGLVENMHPATPAEIDAVAGTAELRAQLNAESDVQAILRQQVLELQAENRELSRCLTTDEAIQALHDCQKQLAERNEDAEVGSADAVSHIQFHSRLEENAAASELSLFQGQEA